MTGSSRTWVGVYPPESKPMPDLNVILSGLAYALLTGIFNAIFAHKSAINSWAETNPRLAGVLKITRALGLDPMHLWAAGALIVKGRLPKVQTDPPEDADDTVHFGPPGPLLVLLLVAFAWPSEACSSVPLTTKRCDFQNPEYSAHVALCRKRIEADCLLNEDATPRVDCPALVECEAWRKEQCK
jgi:hypothetical protein